MPSPNRSARVAPRDRKPPGPLGQTTGARTDRIETVHPARGKPKRNTPGIPTMKKNTVTGRIEAAMHARGDTARTAKVALGATAMPEGDTPPMMIRPVQTARASGTVGPAAVAVGTDVDMTPPTRMTTVPNRMVSAGAQADAVGPLGGTKTDGPR